jgi:putative ABC transport system substrate-binding protein
MDRRKLIALLGGTILVSPLDVRGQAPGRTYRVGSLNLAPRDAPQVMALFDELNRLGFVEGRNLQIDGHGYGLRYEQFAQHAAELVETKVDVIHCAGAAAIRAAQQATATTPILGITDDMVGEGLVRSMAHPGGNATGVSILATELDGKRQELLIELIPGIRRIAALADSHTTAPNELQALKGAARARGVELDIHAMGTPEEIAPAIDAAKASGATGLNVLASPLLNNNRRIIFERTTALGLPAMYQWPEMAQEGGLVAYGPSILQLNRQQMSRLLVQLLRGTKPADLPVEQPTTFQLVVNLKTAQALGLAIPPSILGRADEVIE